MNLNEMRDEAHSTAITKGWWAHLRNPLEVHMLIVSEVAEATEAARIGEGGKEQEELADAVIRIADYFGFNGWDLEQAVASKMAKNKGRAYRHGGKLY